MTPDPVAFLDSGVGGLPYLAHARAYITGRRFVYVADLANFPYGEKSRAEVVSATLSVAERLIRREHPVLVVVACNTMSVAALSELRARFTVPFVGVVPAVKPAALQSRRRKVGVLATRQTVEGAYLHDLIARHATGCSVVSLSSASLVDFVERDLYRAGQDERRQHVREEVRRFTDEGVDALVLGCTHFLHLEREFKAELDALGILLVDSRDGVSRQAARLLPHPPSASAANDAQDSLYVTGESPDEERYRWFAAEFGLSLVGGL